MGVLPSTGPDPLLAVESGATAMKVLFEFVVSVRGEAVPGRRTRPPEDAVTRAGVIPGGARATFPDTPADTRPGSWAGNTEHLVKLEVPHGHRDKDQLDFPGDDRGVRGLIELIGIGTWIRPRPRNGGPRPM